MDTPAARPYTYEVHEHDTITATGQLLLDKLPEPGDLFRLNNRELHVREILTNTRRERRLILEPQR